MKKSIDEIIKDKTLFLKVVSNGDVIKYGLKERDYQGQLYSDKKGLMNFFEILSITKSDVVGEVYERFLKAGVDIIVTNTAKANRFHLEKFGLGDITYELNLEATKIARSKATKYSSIVRDKKRFLGGTLTNLSEEIDFETAKSYYSEQIKALFAGKVDFIFLSEMEDEQSLKAALSAIDSLMKRRNKFSDILISLKNPALFKVLKNDDFNLLFSNLNIIASGFVLEYGDSALTKKINKLTKGENREMLTIFNNTNFEEEPEEMLLLGTEFLKYENYKILGFVNNFSPEFIKKYYKINFQK